MLLPAETTPSTTVVRDSGVLLTMGGDAATTYAPTPTWVLSDERVHRFNATARRWLNVAVAATMLILLMPLMIVVGLLVKLTSTGPILYTQARVGVDRRWKQGGRLDHRRIVDHGGRLFRIYKFRTMRVEPAASQSWAQKGDPRITPIGGILRKLRLDELPQLINVLLGDMNIVGPRPEQPRIFAELRHQIPSYAARQRVLPGITGLAQVNQHYDTCMDDVRRKVQYDLEYIRKESPLADLRILMATLPAVVVKRGGW
jgi:lipopolysaccharide/colanic/teichoic acid biosynthesis glycosyltransferase